MKVRITKEVKLGRNMERTFYVFWLYQKWFKDTGDEVANKGAEKLKPYIDRHWDLYQAWKEQRNLADYDEAKEAY